MRTKLSLCLVCVVAVGVLCWNAATAAEKEPSKRLVRVDVSAKDALKSEFESYIKRELRGLKDVEVVESSNDFTISFVVVEVRSKGGVVTGYAISEVVTHKFPQMAFQLMFKEKLSKEDLAWIAKATDACVLIDSHNLSICGTDELKKTCEKIVAEFDTEMLEPGRKMMRQLQEMMETSQKNPAGSDSFKSGTNNPSVLR